MSWLELVDAKIAERRATLKYTVGHNVGRLPTTLEQDLDLTVDLGTGAVTGALHITDLTADSLDGAREKLAVWCERLAYALRAVQRKNHDLPIFERKPVVLEELPLWLQREYRILVTMYKEAQNEEDRENIRAYLKGHPMNYVSDLVELAQAEADNAKESRA
ncbi:hypothetical protein [Paraburkholderia sp. A3RO-2L]|uniref:hypothetical protein n=1 Tax=Paraburkholderia sp. A3RO-2L TaxID=3028376 RepID=UPI0032FDC5BF|nr:hypothetical protein [Burkholderia vietnamiensis]